MKLTAKTPRFAVHFTSRNGAGNSSVSRECASKVSVPLTEQICNLRSFLVGYARTIGASPDDAQDLAQDTMMLALHHAEQFRHGSSLHAWLATILYRRNVSRWRRGQRFGELSHFFATERGCDGAGVEALVHEDHLQRVLESLSPAHRAVFEQLILGDTYVEIAATLGIPEGTVKSRIWRAKDKLELES